MNRETGELLVAQKYDPKVNWTSGVDMKTGRPTVVKQYSTDAGGPDVDVKGICPAALGSKDQQPASYDRKSGLMMVPTNHVVHDATSRSRWNTPRVSRMSARHSRCSPRRAAMAAWVTSSRGIRRRGKIVWSKPERFSVWSGALTTAGDVVFYGTLEGYIKAVSPKDGKELWKFKTPSGIIGNVFTLPVRRQAVRRRVLGHRRLGRHRHGSGSCREHRRTGCRGRLQRPGEVHNPRWIAVRLRAT